MGLIGTRSLDKQIPGIREIKLKNRERIVSGIEAVKALDLLRKNPGDSAAKVRFEAHKADLGFGLLLKKYVSDFGQIDRLRRSVRRGSVASGWRCLIPSTTNRRFLERTWL